MSLFLHPEKQPQKSRWLVRPLIPLVARRASAIIAVSRSSKEDILKVLKVAPDKVHVIPESASPEYRVLEDTAAIERVRREYALSEPFILCVGTIEPRKNLMRLVEAHIRVRKAGRKEMLLLAGSVGWKCRGLLRQLEHPSLRGSVRLLGYVSGADLPALYNLARVVAFPSLYEGFGLPILEGMACGVPVLTSHCSSMAEVAEGAACLVDPLSVDAIEDGLFRLLTDDCLRDSLRAAGLQRAAQFSWARAAAETAQIYRSILH